MSAGRVRLDRDRIVALAVISCLEAQCTFSADREERDVWSGVIRTCRGGTSRLPGSATACVQYIEKPARIRHQRLDGIGATRAERRVLRGGEIAKVVIDLEAGNLIILLAGDIHITDCVICAAGGHSQPRSQGYRQGQTDPAEFPELHAFPSSPSLSRSRAAFAAETVLKIDPSANCKS